MDKLTMLRTLRGDVAEPSSEQLAPTLSKLERSFQSKAPRKHAPRVRIAVAVTATASILTLVAGNLHVTAQSAQAVSVLRDAAAASIEYSDVTSGPGEYLHSHTRSNAGFDLDLNNVDKSTSTMKESSIDVYMPSDPSQDWVLHRDPSADHDMRAGLEVPAGSGTGRDQDEAVDPELGESAGSSDDESISAPNGKFYDGKSWIDEDVNALPTDAKALFEHFDSQYVGGGASRGEDTFTRIVDLLRSGLIPADLRAGLYGALALIPGVTSTADVANLDGVTGIAIGRTEPLRFGLRDEIIIDPNTGLVIGERQIATKAVFGFGINEVSILTAITTTVVSEVP